MNTLVIGCTHIPFEHRRFLDFVKQQEKKYKCRRVVHCGDVVDFHSISRWETENDSMSPQDELLVAKKHLRRWYKAFPNVYVSAGNHDKRVYKRATESGLPHCMLKSMPEILECPKGWKWALEWEFDDVIFEHGTGTGENLHKKRTITNQQSTIVAHIHSECSVAYITNRKRICVAGFTGSGADPESYAMRYGKGNGKRPVLGCLVLLENGRVAFPIPMEMGK